MALKSINVTRDFEIAVNASGIADGTGGSGLGIVGALLQSLNAEIRRTSNLALTAAGVAMGTTTTKAKTVNSLTYLIDGVFKVKAGTDDFWTLSGTTVPIGGSCLFVFLINAAGTASVVQGPVSTTSTVTTVPVAQVADSLCIVATLKVVSSTVTFVPGTTALNAANLTFTFADGFDGSLIGPSQIATL